jgi:hypothetical protein
MGETDRRSFGSHRRFLTSRREEGIARRFADAPFLTLIVAAVAVVALLAGCGGDDSTETVTVTTTASESQPPPTGPVVAELQQVMTTVGYYVVTVFGGRKAELRLKLHRPSRKPAAWAGAAFDQVIAARGADADEFYAALAPATTPPEQMRVLRQACAGLVWSKQMYPYNVRRWLDGDRAGPSPPASRQHGRNNNWRHLDAFDVLSMPDPWDLDPPGGSSLTMTSPGESVETRNGRRLAGTR